MSRLAVTFILLVAVALAFGPATHAQETSTVHAILFYSPTCPHCHTVIQESLPPIADTYGDQLQIILVNVQTPGGQSLYRAAADWAGIPEDNRGVPLMVVGENVLSGSYEIPNLLPGIIEEGLAAGGITWPSFPGMEEVVAQIEAQEEQASTTSAAPGSASGDDVAEVVTSVEDVTSAEEAPSMDEGPSSVKESAAVMEKAVSVEEQAAVPEEAAHAEVGDAIALDMEAGVQTVADMSISQRLALDPIGSAIALIVLFAMVVTVILVLVSWLRHGLPADVATGWRVWFLPLLALVGLAVALYLGFVETTETAAVCGPVGNCNAVQQSPYARLGGVLPIGILGALGYFTILFLWGWQRLGSPTLTHKTAWMMPAVALVGTLFSIYLTYLEPFVIAAICMWCVSSAIIMTLILWLSYRWRVPNRRAQLGNTGAGAATIG